MKAEYREPPLPEWCIHNTPGVCRWCGHLIWKTAEAVNKRRNWHPAETGCLREYFIATDPAAARRAVADRDKGKCACCGEMVPDDQWQADHILRLADCPRDLKYWSLENLQTMCLRCHTSKNIKENKNNKRTK